MKSTDEIVGTHRQVRMLDTASRGRRRYRTHGSLRSEKSPDYWRTGRAILEMLMVSPPWRTSSLHLQQVPRMHRRR